MGDRADVWILDRFGPGLEENDLAARLGTYDLVGRWLDWDGLMFDAGGSAWYRGEPLDLPLAALVRSRVFTRADVLTQVLDCLRILECHGVAVVNSPESIQRAHNKVLAATMLHCSGVQVPPTRMVRTIEEAGRCLLDWEHVVFKPVNGHSTVGLALLHLESGHGVDTPPGVTGSQEVQLWHLLRYHYALCAQEFQEHDGMEYRVLLVDEKVVACNRRRPDFTQLAGNRSHRGYEVLTAQPTTEVTDIACAAMRALGLRHGAADIVDTSQGFVTLEVNPMISRWCDLDALGHHATSDGVGSSMVEMLAAAASRT